MYDELRRTAARFMGRERANHTLQGTALVHEAYLKLVGGHVLAFEGKTHFYNAAADAMRKILVDHARAAQGEPANAAAAAARGVGSDRCSRGWGRRNRL